MPTTEIKTIKPGGGGDYVSLNAWSTAEAVNLVTANKIKVAECYSGGNCLTGALDVHTGWTTDTTHYMEIRAASGQEHNGTYDESKAYGKVTNAKCIDNSSRNVHINKMQFNSVNGTGTAQDASILGATNSVTYVVDRCIFKSNAITNDAYFMWSQDHAGGQNASVTVTNSLILMTGSGNPKRGAGLYVQCAGTFNFYNNTFSLDADSTSYPCYEVNSAGATITSQNNYLRGPKIYTTDAGTISKGSNDATSNAEATTSTLRNIPYTTATFQNITTGSENLRLTVSGSNKLLDGGTDLSGSGVTTDIIGVARPQFTAFDIGAFENDIPVCWNYTARYKGSSKLFKVSGCGPFPKRLRVPNNVNTSTGRMIDDGQLINPSEYEVII